MLTISFPRPSLGVSPAGSLEAAKQWVKLRITARHEKLQHDQISARLQRLSEQDPGLYADLRTGHDPSPPARSAVLILPHAVIAGYFLGKQRQ